MSGTSQADRVDEATDLFADHRGLLFSIVYGMLGSRADTDDVLQETWLSWSARKRSADAGDIENPRAYLIRIAVNRALAQQAAMNRRRETYIGTWLPEPLVEPLPEPALSAGTDDAAVRAEAVSMALLVVLETLTPVERAVFVLNEVFGYAHTEIAGMLGRSPATVRQHAHRARERVRARRPRFEVDQSLRRRATERFLEAAIGRDMGALLELLAPDVTLWTDGGGKAPAAGRRPIRGRDNVARVLVSTRVRFPPGMGVEYRRVNGNVSALLFDGDSPFGVLTLDLTADGDRVCGVYAVTNPDKLVGVN
ncbi:RNA polymerase sigma factor SigJ [Actinomadura sediminis]|uniref:RNA polymerase sigma factor SigJ n=1 Tax=Actinomadura sediminis TaxID=1038904 RepID=A0ABW3EGI9_9ACTN